jgi:hypothetical protein
MPTTDGHAAPVLFAVVGYAEHSVARILCKQGSCGSANNARPTPYRANSTRAEHAPLRINLPCPGVEDDTYTNSTLD